MIDFKVLIKSFHYAFEGIAYTLKYNQNIRIHLFVALLVVIASIIFKVTPFEMGILGIMIILVISTEMINSAIEQMVNLIIQEHRKEAKVAKDVGAGMVLVTSLGSVVVGILIFVPHILRLFK
jgi:diacylglycerol kinase (ATP)